MSLLVVIFALFVAASEIDIIVPSFPQMQEFFGVSPFIIELALGANLLAHCIAALVVGSLGDKYGKKQVIKWGFILFIAGSVIGGVASGFTVLLIGRIIQGIGVAPAVVLSYLIEMERRTEESEKVKVMGLINGVATLGISLAPTIGSYVSLHFGWKGNFWLMGILGMIALFLFNIFIPEDKKRQLDAKISIFEYFSILKDKRISLYIAALCFAIGAYYTFIGMASLLYINGMNVSLEKFGFHLGILTLTFGIISIFSGKIIKIIGKKKAFYISLLCVFGCLATNIILIAFNINNPFIITLSMLFQSIGFVVPCNTLFPLAVSIKPEASGKVSALISTFKWVFTIIGVQVSSFFYAGSYFPVGLTIVLMIAFSIVLCIKLWKEDERMKSALLGSFSPPALEGEMHL